MTKSIIYNRQFSLLIFLLVLLTGCMNEQGEENCPTEIRLSFRYTKELLGENLMLGSVCSVHVYLFDSNDKYIDTYSELVADLNMPNFEMIIPVDKAGTYKIVTIGDAISNSYIIDAEIRPWSKYGHPLTPSESNINNLRTYEKHNNGVVDKELDDFFLGESQGILADNSGSTVYTVDLIKNNKLIYLTIEGLGDLQGLTPILRAKNGIYDKRNYTPLVPSLEITNKAFYKEPGKTEYIISTLRIIETIDMPITIENESGNNYLPLSNWDLVSLIRLNGKYSTQEALDREDVFKIKLEYSNDILIAVTVNDWRHVIIIPEA